MTTSDDGHREIQLHGKQLVFLFMAVTVVSVVIFLCGVLVGRGVQGRGAQVEAAVVPQPDAQADAAATPPTALPDGPTKAEDLGYPERLQSPGAPTERLVTRPEPSIPAPPATSAAAPAGTPPSAAAADAVKAPPTPPAPVELAKGGPDAPAAAIPAPKPIAAEPKGDGVAIQVAALRGQSEAEAVVARLKGKGYSAYLMPPLTGQPSMFRVRVGKFKTRAEAETVATRLEREEQFKPWITR